MKKEQTYSLALVQKMEMPSSLLLKTQEHHFSDIFAENMVDYVLLSGYTGRRRMVKHTERGKQR